MAEDYNILQENEKRYPMFIPLDYRYNSFLCKACKTYGRTK